MTGPFNMLDHGSEPTLTGSEFKLDWTKDGDDQWAQVKFIEIDYIVSQVSGKLPFLGQDINLLFLLL